MVLDKKDTVLYLDNYGHHTVQVSEDGELAIRRTKVYACALVVITILCFAGTLTALALSFDRICGLVARVHQVGDSDTITIAPSLEPAAIIGSKQPIRIDDVSVNPVTSALTATSDTDFVVDFGTVSGETASPSPSQPRGDEVAEGESSPIESSPSSSSSDDESPSYYGRTYISSSFPYDGFYMRGDTGEPPKNRYKTSSEEIYSDEDTVMASGDISGDNDMESESDEDTAMASASPSPSKPSGNEVAEEESSSIESSSSSSSSGSPSWDRGRTYVSSSFPYYGFYMRGDSGERPKNRYKTEESYSDEDTAMASGDMSGDNDLESETSSDSGYSEYYVSE